MDGSWHCSGWQAVKEYLQSRLVKIMLLFCQTFRRTWHWALHLFFLHLPTPTTLSRTVCFYCNFTSQTFMGHPGLALQQKFCYQPS